MSDQSFADFVGDSLPALGRYAYALTGDVHAAEDLVQDTLVKLSGVWSRVRRDGNPRGYARAVMFRTFVSRWRMVRRRPVLEEVEEAAAPGDSRERRAWRCPTVRAHRQREPGGRHAAGQVRRLHAGTVDRRTRARRHLRHGRHRGRRFGMGSAHVAQRRIGRVNLARRWHDLDHRGTTGGMTGRVIALRGFAIGSTRRTTPLRRVRGACPAGRTKR